MSFYGNDFAEATLSDSEYDAISLKLIKQKSRGIISDYHFEGGNSWSVKARNGAVYTGVLDENCNGCGSVVWYCEGQALRKYYNCSVDIDAESFNIYDEAVELLRIEEAEKAKEIKNEEEALNSYIDDFANDDNMMVA
jgi:hypothetical protein